MALMAIAIDELANEAMQPPASSRAELAGRLFESFDGLEEVSRHKEWMEEALRRRDDVRSGRVTTIPGEQVFAEIRVMLGK